MVVRDPEAETFDLEHNAPTPTKQQEEIEQTAQAEALGDAPQGHHLEDQFQDEDLDEELQDEFVSEDEFLDMAPARELFDEPNTHSA